MRFNNDSSNTYAYRGSTDGGADVTANTQSSIQIFPTTTDGINSVTNIINISTKEKILHGHSFNGGGVGVSNPPDRREIAGKWANTSNSITRIDVINTGTGDFAIGSEVVIWGRN